MSINPYKGSLHEGDGRCARAWELGRLAGLREAADEVREVNLECQAGFAAGVLTAVQILDRMAQEAA